ncbi:MAG: hypothetical protein JWR75_363 [Devosia sp.]|nr:hypothetical protein [Devosia sp.]
MSSSLVAGHETEPSDGTVYLLDLDHAQPQLLPSSSYSNREEIVRNVHAEFQAGSNNVFEISVGRGFDGPESVVACRAETLDGYLRFCLSFTLDNVVPGDLLDIVWISRVTGGTLSPKLMVSGLDKRGKSMTMEVLESAPDDGTWLERHLFTQVLSNGQTDLFHLVFEMLPNCLMEVAALQVVKVGNRAVGLDRKGDSRLVPVGKIITVPAQTFTLGFPSDGAGVVESIDAGGVSGIAWMTFDPASSVALDLYVDGAAAGILAAEPMTGDSYIAQATPGHFRAALPIAALDGKRHSLELRVASTGTVLRGSPREVYLPNPQEGVVQLGSDGALSGWAIDRAISPAPVTVEIIADGLVVAEVVADNLHTELAGAGYNNGHCAFRFPLPLSLRDGRVHQLFARFRLGQSLAGGPFSVRFGQNRFLVHVDPVALRRVTGWITDTLEPGRPVALSVWVDGRLLGEVKADRRVAALADRRAGFSIPLPDTALSIGIGTAAIGPVATFDIIRAEDGETTLADRELPALPLPGPSAAKAALSAEQWSGLFDADWYLVAYPDVSVLIEAGKTGSALSHYLEQGAARGRSPNAWFDESWYQAQYIDAREAIEAGIIESGFQHWLSVGAREWRRPGPGVALAPKGSETSVTAVADWLRGITDLSSQSGNQAIEISLAATYKAANTARSNPRSVFNSHVRRMIEDVALDNEANGRVLEGSLQQNELDAVGFLLEHAISTKPLVSIIMPTFNRGFLIAEAIQSILDQSWTNWELIVCDDGSTDKTEIVVQSFSDPRIRYLRLEKSNGAVARNFGLKFAHGSYLAFLDSDNIWHPLFLEISLSRLIKTRAGLVYSGYIDTDTTGARVSSATLKLVPFDYQGLLRRNFIDLNSIVLDRGLYDVVGGFDESLQRVQDWDLVLRYTRLVQAQSIPLYTTLYRRNVAWGQVTSLNSTTDFNAIVAKKALRALELDTPSIASGDRRILTIIAGGDVDQAKSLVCLAAILAEDAEVRLVLPDSEKLRRMANDAVASTDVEVIWRRAGQRTEDFLVGEAAILAPDVAPFLGGKAGMPVLRVGSISEQLSLSYNGVGPAIGTMHLNQLSNIAAFDGQLAADLIAAKPVMFIVPQHAEAGWRAALIERNRAGKSSLLITIGVDGHRSATLFDAHKERVLDADDRGILGYAQYAKLILLTVPSRWDKFMLIGTGIVAQQKRVPLLVIDDEAYAAWRSAAVAIPANVADLARATKQVDAVLADTLMLDKLAVRGRRRFDHLYKVSTIRDRLKIVLSLLLDR